MLMWYLFSIKGIRKGKFSGIQKGKQLELLGFRHFLQQLPSGNLGLNLTFFGQDWGGLIGLRMVAADSDRFSKVASLWRTDYSNYYTSR